MATTEDCASVLEQFIHDASNLPAEISHMLEEIQAKDAEMQKHHQSTINKDMALQKHIKLNGVLQAHPKESEYADQIKKNFDSCSDLQSQKILLSERACALLDRQLKKLDVKIRELQSDGQLTDGPPLPSIFTRKADPTKSFIDIPPNMPLQPASISNLNANAHRLNAQMTASLAQAQTRQLPQLAALNTAPQRSSAPATPAAVLQQQQQQQRQRERDHSAGPDSKKRKLGNPLAGANLPAHPSSLRQSSLGPGTPKAGTPTGTSGSRAGSIPRTTAAIQAASATSKKSSLSKKVLANHQLNKIKNKHTKHARLSSANRKSAQSPSIRGGRTNSDGEDSVLSSADASETDTSQSRLRKAGRKRQQIKKETDVEMVEEEDHEEEEVEDNTRYCFCNEPSYGNMVGCENDDCKYQWFHMPCLNMKHPPGEDEDWYCPECREFSVIKLKIEQKKAEKQRASVARR